MLGLESSSVRLKYCVWMHMVAGNDTQESGLCVEGPSQLYLCAFSTGCDKH